MTHGVTGDAASVLHAILGMGILTLVMAGWMVLTRLPAMSRLRLPPQSGAHTAQLRAQLPSEVLRIGDNYNHLFEAPTLFYAVSLAIVLLGLADGLQAKCAWAYLALRVVHSLVQATVNIVMIRFVVFSASMGVLGVMIARAVVASLG